MMSQARAPEPTEIAGRYLVEKKLGAGAFGTVYKARDKILKRLVAIKTIRLEGLAAAGADLQEMLKRFEQEATSAAVLKHPNIVTIYDIGETDGLSYIAMECIEGPGLDKIIATEGKLPIERAASLGAQVADALDFAHKHGKIHRDIKPANIMVEPGDRVKVTDFGIAKDTLSGEHLTMTGSLLGTPSYMSPEQAKGGAIDGRSDLFSVGCVLYEMVGGKKAFRGESITALIFKIITEEPPSIRELDPKVPDAYVRIVEKALAKNVDQRYQSGRELADDLLALTRPGSSPTMRQTETPTAPGGTSPLASPTLQSTPTLQAGLPTLNIPSQAPPTTMTPPPVPGPVTPLPLPKVTVPPPVPRPQLAAAAPAAKRKSGSGAGLLIGLGIFGLLFAAAAAGAGWYFFLRKPATEPLAEVVPPPTAPPATAPAETVPAATPAIEAPSLTVAPAPTPPASTVAAAPATTLPAARTAPTPSTTRTARATTKTAPDVTTPPQAEVPQYPVEEPPPDGRAAGESVASKYRSGQGSPGTGYGTGGANRRRERTPTQLAPIERPVVNTIRLICNAQEAFHAKNGRYGTLAELHNAQVLFLDVPHDGGVVMRPGYRINLEVQRDGFRALATPLTGGRFFVGDDSGIIRPGAE
jgi:eukaryotic-like serine/threonine-protein kinase